MKITRVTPVAEIQAEQQALKEKVLEDRLNNIDEVLANQNTIEKYKEVYKDVKEENKDKQSPIERVIEQIDKNKESSIENLILSQLAKTDTS